MKNNLLTILGLASYDEYEAGVNWYQEAREYCAMVSTKTNTPFIVTCAILAALSPRNRWERNKLDCLELCRGNHSHKFGTFNSNVRKAKFIMSLSKKQDIVNALNGPKIIAFFDNIYDENSERVTVDTWMLTAFYGSKLTENDRPSLTVTLYNEIESAVIELAQELKLRPYEAQAIIWTAWRNV